jgi:hypothetical protein
MTTSRWIAAIIMGAAFVGVCVWIVYAFYRTQVRAVKKCRKSAQAIHPPLIWMGVIPILGFFFMFWSIWQIIRTLRKEFKIRGRRMTGKINAAFAFGYAFLLAPFLSLVPHCRHICEIAFPLCILLYWHKIASLSSVLGSGNEFIPDSAGERQK